MGDGVRVEGGRVSNSDSRCGRRAGAAVTSRRASLCCSRRGVGHTLPRQPTASCPPTQEHSRCDDASLLASFLALFPPLVLQTYLGNRHAKCCRLLPRRHAQVPVLQSVCESWALLDLPIIELTQPNYFFRVGAGETFLVGRLDIFLSALLALV